MRPTRRDLRAVIFFVVAGWATAQFVLWASVPSLISEAQATTLRSELLREAWLLLPLAAAAAFALYRLHTRAFEAERSAVTTLFGVLRLFIIFFPVALILMVGVIFLIVFVLIAGAVDVVRQKFGAKPMDLSKAVPRGAIVPFVYLVHPLEVRNGFTVDDRRLVVRLLPFWIAAFVGVIWLVCHPSDPSGEPPAYQLLALGAFWIGDAVTLWLAMRDSLAEHPPAAPSRVTALLMAPLRALDRKEDAFVGAAFASLLLLFTGLSAKSFEQLASIAAALALSPLVALLGAAMFRYHQLWLRDEDREGIRVLVGLPRLMGHFFGYGYFALFAMIAMPVAAVLVFPLRRLSRWWKLRRLRGDVAREISPPGRHPLMSFLAVPLWFLLAPVERYSSSNGAPVCQPGPQWHMYGPAALFAPIPLGGALWISVVSDVPVPLGPLALGLSLAFWVGDFLNVLFAMYRLRPAPAQRTTARA